MLKQSVWLIWIGSLAAFFFGGGAVATLGGWLFGVTLAFHVVECLINLPLFRRAGGSLSHHVVQTLIYGVLHWMPIRQELQAREAGVPNPDDPQSG